MCWDRASNVALEGIGPQHSGAMVRSKEEEYDFQLTEAYLECVSPSLEQ